MAFCDANIFIEGGVVRKIRMQKAFEKYIYQADSVIHVIPPNVALLGLCEDSKCKSWLWNKLFKRSLFDGVSFSQNLGALEDFQILPDLIMKTSAIALTNKATYNYFVNKDSLSNKSEGSFSWLKVSIERYYKVKGIDKKAADLSLKAYVNILEYILSLPGVKSKLRKTQEEQKFLRCHLIPVLLSRECSLRKKIKYILLSYAII